MRLLIDIPDWLYQHIVDFGVLESDEPELYWAIYKGQKVLAEDIIKMKSLQAGLFPLFSRRKKGGLEMKLATIDVPPYEESYPYNVLYDILLIKEKTDYTCEEVSAKEELRKYDIVEFENYMLNRLSDRELRCIECKYRYGMTLEETGQKFSVTKERIRQILARAERKLKYRLHTCYRVPKENYTRVKDELENTKNMYNKLLDFVMDTKNLTEDEITEVLERRVVSEALSDERSISELELSVRAYNCLKRAGLTNIKDIIDLDEKSEGSEWVFKIRNLGRKSVNEIKEKLEEKAGYTMKFWRKSDI